MRKAGAEIGPWRAWRGKLLWSIKPYYHPWDDCISIPTWMLDFCLVKWREIYTNPMDQRLEVYTSSIQKLILHTNLHEDMFQPSIFRGTRWFNVSITGHRLPGKPDILQDFPRWLSASVDSAPVEAVFRFGFAVKSQFSRTWNVYRTNELPHMFSS